MKVELSIADDRELRAAVRDMIKGEVASVMRGEIKNIIAELVKEGALPKDTKSLEDMVTKATKEVVKEQLGVSPYGSSEAVRKMAREEVSKIVQEIFKADKYLLG